MVPCVKPFVVVAGQDGLLFWLDDFDFIILGSASHSNAVGAAMDIITFRVLVRLFSWKF